MNFAEAFHDLLNGFLLRRDSWEHLMYVVKRDGYPDGIPINADTARATGLEEGEVRVFHPYLMACAGAERGFTVWTPTTADLFADDWRLYPRQPEALSHTYAEPGGKTAG
jgi:hypothetical protein